MAAQLQGIQLRGHCCAAQPFLTMGHGTATNTAAASRRGPSEALHCCRQTPLQQQHRLLLLLLLLLLLHRLQQL
jgi:hypothetical protein